MYFIIQILNKNTVQLYFKPEFDTSVGFISLIVRVISIKNYIFINFPINSNLLRLFHSKQQAISSEKARVLLF